MLWLSLRCCDKNGGLVVGDIMGGRAGCEMPTANDMSQGVHKQRAQVTILFVDSFGFPRLMLDAPAKKKD